MFIKDKIMLSGYSKKEVEMLKIKRKIGETIVINKDIHITLTKVNESGIQLSIEAPQSIPVDRLEVHQLKESQFQNVS